jgi:hypothetical protein
MSKSYMEAIQEQADKKEKTTSRPGAVIGRSVYNRVVTVQMPDEDFDLPIIGTPVVLEWEALGLPASVRNNPALTPPFDVRGGE